jgi:hypothetical protein
MKIKLTIALVILALVFGISFTACDDGDLQKITPGEKENILDTQYVPYLDKDGNTVNKKYTPGKASFVGKWVGSGLTVTCKDGKWEAKESGDDGHSWSGTYKQTGFQAFFIETNGANFGIASILDDTMTVTSTYGNFSLTKEDD